MLATTHRAPKLVALDIAFPPPIAAVLATPYLYLTDGLNETERILAVAIAEELATKGITEKVILRS